MDLRSKQTKSSISFHLATAKNKLKTFLTAKGLSFRKQAYGLYSLVFTTI